MWLVHRMSKWLILTLSINPNKMFSKEFKQGIIIKYKWVSVHAQRVYLCGDEIRICMYIKVFWYNGHGSMTRNMSNVLDYDPTVIWVSNMFDHWYWIMDKILKDKRNKS